MKVMLAVVGMILGSHALYALTSQEALARLLEGNQRYVQDRLEHPDRTSERREAIQSKQQPFAIILGCSDSRVSPEIVFDQGIGDLFVVRVAGNVVGNIELDSIEYAAAHLKSSLVMVLGHQNCGAVQAVMDGNSKDIVSIANLIQPAVEACKKEKNCSLQNCIQVNVIDMVKRLQDSPMLQAQIEQGKLKIVGGYYSLNTGKVELLSGL